MATATTVHPFVTESGPRHTANTPMPDRIRKMTDMPGMSAMRSGVDRMPSQLEASQPGTISNSASSRTTSRFCGRLSDGPGCDSNFCASAAAAACASATTFAGGVHRPSPSMT